MSAEPSDGPTLERSIDEGRRFARYLIGRDVPPGLLARYAEAVGRLPLEPRSESDAALLRFARRNPWSLPLLDAATGVARRESALRLRLVVMLALLEASVELAEDFLPQPRSRPVALVRVAAAAGVGAAKVLGGLLLLPLAARSR